MDAGLKVKLVFKRRIVNQVLTVFLPTFLILAIVYATNFFKPFFFEAVVTVNLTALLVLTTLFISVSNSLPPTAYIKMIDIWLIFSQLIPLFEVLLHTLMDNLRSEDGRRNINHHGVVMVVGEEALFEDRKTALLAEVLQLCELTGRLLNNCKAPKNERKYVLQNVQKLWKLR